MAINNIVRNSIACMLTLLFAVTCLITAIYVCGMKVEASVSGEVKMIVSQTHAYVEPDMDSEIILDLEVEDHVFVTGEDGDFYVIYYKELTGYVPKYAIDGTQAPSAVTDVSINPDAATLASSSRQAMEDNNKAVDEELRDQEVYNEVLEGIVEQKERARRNTIIWVSVIAALCVGMIIISIIVVVKGKKDM